MKGLHCTIHWHKWVQRQVEDSQYVVCDRCGADRNPGAGAWHGKIAGN